MRTQPIRFLLFLIPYDEHFIATFTQQIDNMEESIILKQNESSRPVLPLRNRSMYTIC